MGVLLGTAAACKLAFALLLARRCAAGATLRTPKVAAAIAEAAPRAVEMASAQRV